ATDRRLRNIPHRHGVEQKPFRTDPRMACYASLSALTTTVTQVHCEPSGALYEYQTEIAISPRARGQYSLCHGSDRTNHGRGGVRGVPRARSLARYGQRFRLTCEANIRSSRRMGVLPRHEFLLSCAGLVHCPK